METNPPPTSLVPPRPPGPSHSGLAIASLVVGILSFVSSLFLIGALFAVVGVILGFAHIVQRKGTDRLAWLGIGLSVLGFLASVAFGILYFRMLEDMRSSSDEAVVRWEGVVAPDLSAKTLDGRTIRLSDFKGKRVVLDFWATWCGPCVMEVPHFIRLNSETSRDDLVIIGVSQEKTETLRKFIAAKGLNYTVAQPENLSSPYSDIRAIPTTFFIDRQGVIQRVLVGAQTFETLRDLALADEFDGEPRRTPASPVETTAGTEQLR